MRATEYDAIVVGARCAGSPTAMLLARKGYKVLVVDQATFPSDTISTHLDPPPGRGRPEGLGPAGPAGGYGVPGHRHVFVRLRAGHDLGSPGTDEAPLAYAPRRTVLDKLLVDAASEAGAEVREGFTVADSSSRMAA